MAQLTPNYTYEINGVLIKEKIIPDGMRWKDAAKAAKAGFAANALYKKNMKLTDNTGKALSITVHNTDDIASAEDDGEQYTRATYNENMGSARVAFYVDDICAWQNLKAGTGLCPNDPLGSAEVGWHAGDGSVRDGGNMTSIGIEVIMNDNEEHDAKAYDNSSRIIAWLLKRHGLTVNDVVTHTYWVNKSVGNHFSDVDEQCTNPVYGKKWCPAYILNSYNQNKALQNWKRYKMLIQKYLDQLNKPAEPVKPQKENTQAETHKDNTPSDWAKPAVDFAVDNDILFGDNNGNYQLRKTCTRQEMLVFLYRMYKLIK